MKAGYRFTNVQTLMITFNLLVLTHRLRNTKNTKNMQI